MGSGAKAQTPPRIKAAVVGFDGGMLTVMPVGEKQSMKIGVRPATRILKTEARTLGDIQPGDYVGATLTKTTQGAFDAREVHVFPPALKGSGEGLYPASPNSGTFILGGIAAQTGGSTLTIRFRGATGEGVNCTGRAVLNPLVGCQGGATIAVAANAPVTALVPGDKSLLVPGAIVTVSIMAGPDGRPVTPGLTVESAGAPAAAAAPTAAPFVPVPVMNGPPGANRGSRRP